jgi:hypothetical protein
MAYSLDLRERVVARLKQGHSVEARLNFFKSVLPLFTVGDSALIESGQSSPNAAKSSTHKR